MQVTSVELLNVPTVGDRACYTLNEHRYAQLLESVLKFIADRDIGNVNSNAGYHFRLQMRRKLTLIVLVFRALRVSPEKCVH